jgi:hypothetical protein
MTDAWSAAQRALGQWEGTASGQPGEGRQTRHYELVLRGAFILGGSVTQWPPEAGQPEREPHEDLCLLSHDATSGQVTMRSYYVEGFVHEYRCAEVAPDGSRLVFEASQVENGPPGMRARETWMFGDEGRFQTMFELALPGADYATYTIAQLGRVKDLDGRG